MAPKLCTTLVLVAWLGINSAATAQQVVDVGAVKARGDSTQKLAIAASPGDSASPADPVE